MLGTLVIAGIGALAFKLGMDSQEMYSKGKNTTDIVASLPGDAVDTVAGAVMACYDPIAKLFSGDKPKNQENKQENKNVKEERP